MWKHPLWLQIITSITHEQGPRTGHYKTKHTQNNPPPPSHTYYYGNITNKNWCHKYTSHHNSSAHPLTICISVHITPPLPCQKQSSRNPKRLWTGKYWKQQREVHKPKRITLQLYKRYYLQSLQTDVDFHNKAPPAFEWVLYSQRPRQFKCCY